MPTRHALAVLLLATLIATGVAQGAPPRVRVSSPPAGLRIGQEWLPVVTVSGARPRAFVIDRADTQRTFRLTGRSGRYRARIVFPAAGSWRYGVRLARRTVFAGRVVVRPRQPVLLQPFGIVEEGAGTILVADWRAGIVYRLDLANRDGSVVARVAAPRDLVRAPDGRLLVASNDQVLELDPATGRTEPVASAEAFVGGIAAAPDGTLYLNETVQASSRIVRLSRDGTRTVLASGLNGVHGILLTPEGLVICESFAGRVLRLEGTRLDVLAQGLGNPSYAARAADGTLYVGEFTASRVTRIDTSGATTPIASVPNPGPVALQRSGTVLVGTLDGFIYRVDPSARTTARVYP